MRTKFLLLFFFLTSIASYAEDYLVCDSVYYVIDRENNEAYVDHGVEARNIVIRDSVSLDGVINYPVTYIKYRAFFNDMHIETVVIPKGCKLSEACFMGCENLRRVEMLYCDSISSGSFYFCKSLKEVVFSDKLRYIGEGAFGYDSSIESFEFPDSVVVCKNVFENCVNLKTVVLGKNTELQDNPFGYNNSLSEVIIPEENCSYCVLDNALYEMEDGVPVRLIRCLASYEDESFVVPRTVKKIEEFAFAFRNIKTVVVSSGIEHLAYHSIAHIKGLTSIIFLAPVYPYEPSATQMFPLYLFSEPYPTIFVPSAIAADFRKDSAWRGLTIIELESGTVDVTDVSVDDLKAVFHGDILNVSGTHSGERISVFSADGSLLARTTANEGTTDIDISKQGGGVVIVTVNGKFIGKYQVK